HPDAVKALLAHSWPGNVRELKNTVERSTYRHLTGEQVAGPIRAIILDPFKVPWRTSEVPALEESTTRRPAGSYDYKAEIDRIERELVVKALEENGQNQRATANHLKLTYDQLRGLIRKFGLADNRPDSTKP
ncbi:MAG: phage shock protein operon transcriptional activator, partial [Geminicoccaceae bacterium]